MKILHVNTYDTGGAANACVRLHQGLMEFKDIQSSVLVRYNKRHLTNVEIIKQPGRKPLAGFVYRMLHHLHLRSHPVKSNKRFMQEKMANKYFPDSEAFSFPENEWDITQSDLYQEADIIHLHWVAYFLDFPSFFKINTKPVVWTLHDMAPFTGGFHYEQIHKHGVVTTDKFFSHDQANIIENNLKIKKQSIENVNQITIVSPSHWLGVKSQQSELFKRFQHHVIPNGVDTNIFKVYQKQFARSVFGLPKEKKIVMFVAESLLNKRKGFDLFLGALTQLSDNDDLLICAVGKTPDNLIHERIKFLGSIEDERLMALAYSAADVFVLPSREDNLPNTMIESLACGTPVIGFPVGGIKETIVDSVNGYLCAEVSINALAETINKFFSNSNEFDSRKISENSQARYSLQRQASSYYDIYKNILSTTPSDKPHL